MTKLIILRGPSGLGKSTIATALMKRTKRPTVLVDLVERLLALRTPN
jgi:guanylate kinase